MAGRDADGERPRARPLAARLAWFIALWLVGAATVGLAAMLIRAVLR